MFKQQHTRIQPPHLQSPIYQPHITQRQSIPFNIPSQIPRNQQSAYNKINSSTKKTNKISLYSKKNTNSVQKIKSPKKNDFYKNQTNQSSSSTVNNAFVNIKNLGDNLLGQMNNIIENNIKSTIPTLMNKMIKKNTNYTANNNNNFIINSQPYKINSEKRIPQKYNFEYSNQQQQYSNQQQQYSNQQQQQNIKYFNINKNKNNISQMIQKQVQSQLNSCGTIYDNTERQTSFFTTGRSGGAYNQLQHNNSNSNINIPNVIKYQQQQQNIITNTINQQSFENIYKFMRQQIFIAKQNYQKKFNDTIKQNTNKIKQLQVKLQKNTLILKQKNIIIEKMNQKIISLNNNQKQQRSLSMGSNNLIIQSQQTTKYEHVFNKINDVQSKLKVLQNYSLNSNKSHNSALIKVQLLQKHLINYFSCKFTLIKNELATFIKKQNQKVMKIQKSHLQIVQKMRQEIINLKNSQMKVGLDKNSMNKLKQIINKFKCLQSQSKQFMTRQFKYHNVGVEQLKLKYDDLKQKLRSLQGHQFQNSKLTKQLSNQIQAIIKTFQSQQKQSQQISPTPSSPLQKIYFIKNLNSSQIQQTYSKYTRTNPNNPNNLSNYSNMNSFDQLSQTNQYSYIVEKINQNNNNIINSNINSNSNNNGNTQYYLNLNLNVNNINKGKQSISNQNNNNNNNNNKKNIKIPSILNNINNINMNDITQNKDQSSIISMNFTQQLDNQQLQSLMYDTNNKPNNNNNNNIINNNNINNNDDKDLKNTNAQLNSQLSTKKSILYRQNNKNNISHNNSYLSIGQMQDYHQNLNTISTTSRNLLDSRQKYHMNQYLNIQSPQRLYSRSIYNDQDDDQFFYYENIKNSNKKYKQNQKQKQSQYYISQQQQTFSPIKNKIFISTQSNFYNHKNNYHKKNINIIMNNNNIINNNNNNNNNNFNTIQSQKRIKPSSNQDISHSSVSFDYQTFVQSDQENQKNNQKDNHFALKINMNKKNYKFN